MRSAIKTSPQDTTWADMLAVWQAADDTEVFESAWTFDHLHPIVSDPTGPCLEGWIATTALAQATRRIRVGVLVTGDPYRHPAVLANMAATLDVLSGGRLELGLGAGWNQERFDRFDEALEAITSLLTDAVTSFAGKPHQRCAEIGRDPSDILISTHLRVDVGDPAAIAAQVTAAEEAGIQLGIVHLPIPHTPSVLEPLAPVLEPLAG